MVNAQDVRKLAARLAKAEALVQAGAVFPVAGLPGYGVVRNGDGTSMYLVRHAAGHDPSQAQDCSCPDYQQRQGKIQRSCKHLLAAEIAAGMPLSQRARSSLPASRSRAGRGSARWRC